jgi:hypothetical protein
VRSDKADDKRDATIRDLIEQLRQSACKRTAEEVERLTRDGLLPNPDESPLRPPRRLRKPPSG